MATPLSDEIRALITFANETTEAGDTKLGDCVKTLCEGYNGGKNVPSSPLVVPSGAISSRLAALLAYANETTGAGDTTMGDAIRTLCEGYGGGELIFYEKLVTDGVAWIITDYFPSAENTRGIRAKGNIPFNVTSGNNQGIYGVNSSTSVSSYRTFSQIAWFNGRTVVYAKIQISSNPYNTHTGTTVNDFDVNCYIDNDGLYHIESIINGTLVTYKPSSHTSLGVATYGLGIFADNKRGVADTHCSSGVSISKFEIEDAELGTLTYVPCTYNGEAGLWCLQTETFFGNAASSGQFTVEGEIGNYLVSLLWNATDMNGYSKTLWNGKIRYTAKTLASNSDNANGSMTSAVVTLDTLIENDKTIFIPKEYLPRYVAITAYPTTNKFPVAHICRYASGSYVAFRSLRNESADLYHIFDLEELFEKYYKESSGTVPALAVRTNMNTFVGSDYREQLEEYLKTLQ